MLHRLDQRVALAVPGDNQRAIVDYLMLGRANGRVGRYALDPGFFNVDDYRALNGPRTISPAAASASYRPPTTSVVGCREHDNNGGDCTITGQLFCAE